jgi:hypothetical protein
MITIKKAYIIIKHLSSPLGGFDTDVALKTCSLTTCLENIDAL